MRVVDNVQVFHDTCDRFEEDEKLLEQTEASIQKTQLYSEPKRIPCPEYICCTKEDNITVCEGTTFDTARALLAKYDHKKRVAVLNFANAYNPGGGVQQGANAQEECLCRCSNLYSCLMFYERHPDFYLEHKALSAIDKAALNQPGLIYTPDVLVIKTDSYEDCPMEKVDVITCAAPDLRKRNMFGFHDAKSSGKELDITMRKIHKEKAKAILQVALFNKVDVIVLGAFGCGVFDNDPKMVAEVYREVLEETVADDCMLKNCFTEVVFAIRAKKSESKNLDAFKGVFR